MAQTEPRQSSIKTAVFITLEVCLIAAGIGEKCWLNPKVLRIYFQYTLFK
jgi:hypothetical protein